MKKGSNFSDLLAFVVKAYIRQTFWPLILGDFLSARPWLEGNL